MSPSVHPVPHDTRNMSGSEEEQDPRKHCHLRLLKLLCSWTCFNFVLLFQVFSDHNSFTKREYWHGTARLASGCQECRTPGRTENLIWIWMLMMLSVLFLTVLVLCSALSCALIVAVVACPYLIMIRMSTSCQPFSFVSVMFLVSVMIFENFHTCHTALIFEHSSQRFVI